METFQPGIQPKLCQRCILPDTFPGIKFDANGICNHCLREESAIARATWKKAEYRSRLDNLIKECKGKAPAYDAVMAYSGGKDSSYTLKLLKERYKLRILSLTLDNHFISPVSLENIKRITDNLQCDNIMFRPPWDLVKTVFVQTAQEDVFSPTTLLRASSICTACIGLVKALVLKTALEMSIPLVAFGWSPGQAPIQAAIMKTNPGLTRQSQSALKKAFPGDIRTQMDGYFVPDIYYEMYNDRFPCNIHPLAFFDYNEAKIMQELRDFGWQAPSDTDTNSSNCLLNAFANQCHLRRHGFHPYVWEIANMVRQKVMDRDDGIEKIYTEQNRKMVEYAKEKLGL